MIPEIPANSSHYVATSHLPVSAEQAFAYHEGPGCLQRLIPPWESVTLESSDGSLRAGSRVVLKTKLFGIPLRWRALHTEYDPPNRFVDVQESGPFASWRHEHRFEAADDGTCRLSDRLQYRLPLGTPGRWFGGGLARNAIESMFAYRHRITIDDLALSSQLQMSPMTIAVSGSTGMIGSSLCSLLSLLGHRVRPIVRSRVSNPDAIAIWSDPTEAQKLDDVDVVVHLAGKSIASGRWTENVKREIRESRVEKTQQLCRAIQESVARSGRQGPRTLICASATGIYGDRGDQTMSEDSTTGSDFLADVATQWEQACEPARQAGLRVVNARIGIVLAPGGGALSKMLTPAKLGGGALGNGRQWWSWIALDDVVGGLVHAIAVDSVAGPINLVAPQPLQQRDFAKILGRVLRRPALVPAPAFGLRLALGEMADALLLSSTRAVPSRLIGSDYRFRFESLEPFLRYCLGKNRLESVT
ncbi:MAG: TIGR01777 family oxidoreductase [Planctomycetota bacterium]